MSGPARAGFAALSLVLLGACASGGVRPDAGSAAAVTTSTTAADPALDWHGLLVAPFGTPLKESPVPLHEVLLFHESPGPAADGGARDCYAPDRAAPRFVGLPPDEYLLCFEHDRLTRIDASVRLDAAQAAQVFARACAQWLNSPAPPAAPQATCAGRDGSVSFSARFVPDESSAALLLTLTPAVERE